MIYLLFFFQVASQNFSDIKHIDHIIQDDYGFVWFTSIKNVYRSDGVHLYEIKHEEIFDKIQYAEKIGDYIFYATNFGLLRVNTNTFSSKLISFAKYRSAFSNPNNIISLKKINEKQIAIGALIGGVLIYDIEKDSVKKHYQIGNDQEKSLISNQALSIEIDRFGRLWVATRNKGLEIIDLKSDLVYHEKNSDFIQEIPFVSRLQFIDSLLCFIAGPNNSLYLAKLEEEQKISFQKVRNKSSSDYIIKSFIKYEDQLLFLSNNKQFVFDHNKLEIRESDVFEDLALNKINDLQVIDDKYLLVATDNLGLKRFPKSRLHIQNKTINDNIISIHKGQDRNFILSPKKIYTNSFINNSSLIIDKAYDYNSSNSIILDSYYNDDLNILVIVSNDELYYFSEAKGLVKYGLNNNQRIFSVSFNKDFIALNANTGIEIYQFNKNKTLKFLKILEKSVIKDFISSVHLLNKNVISLMTHNNNLFYYNILTDDVESIQDFDVLKFTSFKTASNRIIGNDAKNGYSKIINYETDRYIIEDTLTNYISSKHRDVYYIEANRYLYIDENGFVNAHNYGKEFSLNEQYGFNHFPYQNFAKVNDEIFISGNLGITKAPLKIFRDHSSLDNLKISNFSFYNDSSLSITDFSQTTIRIPYNLNTFKIDLTNLHFLNPSKFQYRISKFSTNWINAESSQINLNYMNPGKYLLEIRVSNSKQSINKIIIIEAPWWQSLWFQTIIVLIILLTLIYIFNEKKREDNILEANKQKISKDIHDEIGNKLIKLHYLNDEIITDESTSLTTKSKLNDISSIIGNITHILDDIVWNLNNKNNTFIELINRIDYLIDFSFNNTSFDVQFDKIFKFEDFTLKQNLRENLFYIIKESITNILKHSDQGKIKILFSLDKNKFVYIIQNPLKLKKKFSKRKSYGLQNMTLRANDMNADLSIKEESDKFVIRLRGKL